MFHDFELDALGKNWIAELRGNPEARRLAREWLADAKAGEERDGAARQVAAPSFARRAWRWVSAF